MNAVIYARYSSDSQREESIEGQIRECLEFAAKNKITVLGNYVDRALSAKTDNRPEFQKMIKDSYRKMFDAVIVWKVDRFARNRYDSAYYKNILRKNCVKVISAKEHIGEGAEGIILESMLEGYAEYYSVELAEKINRGLTENALKAKMNGGSIPIGYRLTKDKSLEPDDDAPYVLEAFQRYADGERMVSIIRDFNRRGIKSRYSKKMSLCSLTRMLKNRRYLGEYHFRDIVHLDSFPAIIPKDLFDRVQEKLVKNKKAPARHKSSDDYILTTKLKCGKCGANMIGESGTGRNGNVHHYYKCIEAKRRRNCDKKTVKKEWIENLVVNYTMQQIMDDETADYIADRVIALSAKENTKIPQLKTRLKEINTFIDNLLNAIQQGLFNGSAKKRLDELETEKSEIELAILTEQLARPVLTKENVLFFIKQFRTLNVNDIESRKRLVNCFVNVIYLYDDKILITFNYKEGTKEATFDEISVEFGSDISAPSPPTKACRKKCGGLLFFGAFQRGSMGEKNCVSSFVCLRM